MTYPVDLPDGHQSQGHLTILIDGKNRCTACVEPQRVPRWIARKNEKGLPDKDMTGTVAA